LRLPDQKREAVTAMRGLNYRVISAGDSYNDTTMLGAADLGFLIHAPENVKAEFPQFKPVESLPALLDEIRGALAG
jgi:phosphoserine/homoserine phosphotransferase